MAGAIRIIWDRGVLKEGEKVIAGPGDSITVNSFEAERYVEREKVAHYAK